MSQSSAVAVRQESTVAEVRDTPEELRAIKDLYAKDLSPQEWNLFCAEAKHRRLSIVKGHMVAVKRKGRVTHQVTIHGARHLAERSQLYADSEGPFWCGADGVWKDVWLSEKPPAAAKFIIYRYDSTRPTVAVAVYAERVQTYWKDGREQIVETWDKMPAHMLAKVAESDALKRARLLEDDVELDLGPLPGEYSPKVMALRRLHAVGAERGLDHGEVRGVVQALAPGTESLGSESVGVRELNSASTFVEDADDCDLSGAVAGMVALQPIDVEAVDWIRLLDGADDRFQLDEIREQALKAGLTMKQSPDFEARYAHNYDRLKRRDKAIAETGVDPETGEIIVDDPITEQQAQAIRQIGVRKKLSTEDLEALLGGDNWAEVLTNDEAAQWIGYLGKVKAEELRAEIDRTRTEAATA